MHRSSDFILTNRSLRNQSKGFDLWLNLTVLYNLVRNSTYFPEYLRMLLMCLKKPSVPIIIYASSNIDWKFTIWGVSNGLRLNIAKCKTCFCSISVNSILLYYLTRGEVLQRSHHRTLFHVGFVLLDNKFIFIYYMYSFYPTVSVLILRLVF